MFLPTNSWRAFKQHLLRTPKPVPSLLGWEMVEQANKILVQWINNHSALSNKILQLKSCTRSLSAINPSNTFHKFPCHWNPLKYIHLNDPFPKMSILSSLQWAFLSRLPRSFGSVVINWATYSDPTFLGDHDPKCREVATYNSWKCLRMLPLVYLLST